MNKNLKKSLKNFDKKLFKKVKELASKRQLKLMKRNLKGKLSKVEKREIKKFKYILKDNLRDLFIDFILTKKEKEEELKKNLSLCANSEKEENKYSSCGSYSSCR